MMMVEDGLEMGREEGRIGAGNGWGRIVEEGGRDGLEFR